MAELPWDRYGEEPTPDCRCRWLPFRRHRPHPSMSAAIW